MAIAPPFVGSGPAITSNDRWFRHRHAFHARNIDRIAIVVAASVRMATVPIDTTVIAIPVYAASMGSRLGSKRRSETKGRAKRAGDDPGAALHLDLLRHWATSLLRNKDGLSSAKLQVARIDAQRPDHCSKEPTAAQILSGRSVSREKAPALRRAKPRHQSGALGARLAGT